MIFCFYDYVEMTKVNTTSPVVHCSGNRNQIRRSKFPTLVCFFSWVGQCGVWAKLALTWLQIPVFIENVYLSIVVDLLVYYVARMSVNAPKHELIQLIYRHLKEHGFHSAAEELQIHSPQVNTHKRTHTLTHWRERKIGHRECHVLLRMLCQGLHRQYIFFSVRHV